MVVTQYYPDAITNIVAGLLIIAFGILVGNIFSVLSRKILQAFEVERVLASQGIRFPYEEFVSSIIKYATYIAGLVWGLTFLGLHKIVLYAILIILLGLLILFILLSFKDFVPNFVAGLIIQFTKKVKRNDKIEMDSTSGKILRINLLETTMKTPDGDVVLVPNIIIVRSKITKKK